MHLAVGARRGIVYGALMPRLVGGVLTSGALFGFSVWAVAFGFVAKPRDHTITSPRDMA